MGTQRVQRKGALPRLVRWASRAGTRDFCPAWAVQYFNSLVPITQQAGQAVVLGHLSPSLCLWTGLTKEGGWNGER